MSQRPPFENFLYTLRPSNIPGALFTPFRAGTAYFWIVDAVLRTDALKGHIVAETILYPVAKSIGVLLVTNTERAHPPKSSAAPATEIKELENSFWSNRTYNSLLIHPEHNTSAVRVLGNDMERRYFTCLIGGFARITLNPSLGLVTDVFPAPSVTPNPIEYHVRCNPAFATFRDKMIITIYHLTPPQKQAFRWMKLAEELLVLGTSVSLGYSMDSLGIITDSLDQRHIATIQIRLHGTENGSDEPSTSNVTTA
ncbi:MAG: hypothetical protein Q9182_004447 [Xanthomendoza sp. 2 TL-2023]